ncbi:unnamed protein product [Caenorhabditis nigoni]
MGDTESLRSCYDKLRKAVGNIPMDASKSAKLQNLSSGKISKILPNLYLSGRTVSQNSELLKEKNIRTVINVSDREVKLNKKIGVSRSATLVAFYLITAFGINWRDAVDYIHHRRFSANPNFGFLHQLKIYSNTKAAEARCQLTSQRCLRMRESDRDVIKKYLPLAVIEL